MTINELLTEFFSRAYTERSLGLRLLTMLLEYWATEKDYELKNQLLNSLILKYATTTKKLLELNQQKNRLLGIAAHDLRNPLTSIRGLSDIMLSEATGPITDEQREYLKIIRGASNDMLILVNNLLDVSVIESGRLELDLQKRALRPLVEERMRIHKVLAEEKGISLLEEFSEIPEFRFDRGKVAQVIDNLLSNAIKFSPPGSKIWVGLQTKNGTVRVSVRDQGPGISEEDQPKIFGEFEKAQTKPTGNERRTGLGLAIVKKIVEAHGGCLEIESRPGHGTKFSLSLPLET